MRPFRFSYAVHIIHLAFKLRASAHDASPPGPTGYLLGFSSTWQLLHPLLGLGLLRSLNSIFFQKVYICIDHTYGQANEELRARFRHLDLRRDTLTENLRKRSRVAHAMRNFLHDEGKLPFLLRPSRHSAEERSKVF